MPVSSGVTQGSNLGPILFNIFVNDVVQYVNGVVFLYADDLKIVKYIRTPSDCESLQDSLNNFIHCCDTNQLKVNVNKCHFMRFSRKAENIEFNYSISNVQLDKKSESRDLGIILDSNLCP
jgi:ribonuclease P/MRP protein subunit RPP40